MTIQYTLKLLESFKCLMSDCPDNCCYRDWDLPVDDATISNWRKLSDQALKTQLLDSVIVRNEQGEAVEVLKHQDNNRCVHVSDEGLCSIQVDHGHQILPETCQQYPREQIVNKATTVATAHMSCPEVVQLLMTQDSKTPLASIFQQEPSSQTDSRDISFQLECSSLNILSQHNFPLAQRLYLIAAIIEQLKQQSKSDPLDEARLIKISQLSGEQITRQFKDCQKKISGDKLKINKKIAGLYWQFVYSSCRAILDPDLAKRIASSSSLKQIQELLQTDNISNDKIQLKYFNILSRLNNTIPSATSKMIDTILTRYLVVKFKNHGYPWFLYKNNLILTFLDCIIPYSQITMVLGFIFESQQLITENDILTAIYKVERHTAHNTRILADIENKIEFSELLLYAGSW